MTEEMSEPTQLPEWLRDMTVLRLQPGDVLVCRSERIIPMDTVASIMARLRHVFPNHQVVVLTDGLELGVLRPENAP